MKNDYTVESFTKPPKIKIETSYYTSDGKYEGDGKFNKGDVVVVTKIDSPEMIVLDVLFEEGKTGKDVYSKNGNKILLGILCGWFTTTGQWNEHLFNSKELEKVDYEQTY